MVASLAEALKISAGFYILVIITAITTKEILLGCFS